MDGNGYAQKKKQRRNIIQLGWMDRIGMKHPIGDITVFENFWMTNHFQSRNDFIFSCVVCLWWGPWP